MLAIELGGEQVYLLPQRALYRCHTNTLYIADTHWGKPAAFRAHHIMLPEGGLTDELAQLTTALVNTAATRLVILGDLVHSRHSLAEVVVTAVTHWRVQHPKLHIQLVKGNHDKTTPSLPPAWAIDVCDGPVEDYGWMLAHEPTLYPDKLTLAGHLHPMWRLQGRGKEQLSVPCFVRTHQLLVLPAFCRFAGSTVWELAQPIQQAYGVTHKMVIPLIKE